MREKKANTTTVMKKKETTAVLSKIHRMGLNGCFWNCLTLLMTPKTQLKEAAVELTLLKEFCKVSYMLDSLSSYFKEILHLVYFKNDSSITLSHLPFGSSHMKHAVFYVVYCIKLKIASNKSLNYIS